MNSTSTFLITTILAFALLSSITTSSVFATGNLDDEEEEEVLEQLQTAVQEIQGTLGTLTLNLTEGSNNIEANCPTTAEIVEEVIENITTPQEPEQNVTEPQQPAAECPIVQQPAPEPVQNQTVVQPVEAQPEPQQNQTCDIPLQQNVTEIVEELIENVTVAPVEEPEQQPTCNPIQEFIPGIVLPNVTEPIPEPVQNETGSELEPIICPVNGELLGYTNTTSGEQLPISAGENQTVEQVEQQPQNNVTDEQEIASIEFEAACGCFVVDKTPEDLESNGGGSVEQSLYNQ